ncbi:uncharacterized protein LOC110462029 [Mizuhopecten yessoensis]|uniref:uncharacterized protein LOC110462029 n=1 Tax=Mizuhopecten yessoensis TaxID=6573 RepID=UPI000B45A1E2|nr:uncharacterized protein LOC110462029 [Mizuhopecten yessoensis]
MGVEPNTSDRRPSPRELSRLSRLINPSRIEAFFLELGLSMLDIEDTECESYNLPRITRITKLFLKWTIAYPNKTIHDIQQAMEAVNMATDRINDVLGTDEESQVQGMVPLEVWNRVPSEDEIRKIVENIDKMYFNMCLELGLSPPTIAQCELCHPTFGTRMSALLRCWIDRYQTEATIGRLLTAMKVCQMDWHTTCYERLMMIQCYERLMMIRCYERLMMIQCYERLMMIQCYERLMMIRCYERLMMIHCYERLMMI